MNDRRKTGVNHRVLENHETGETVKLVTATARTGHLILGVILALFTLIGGMYTAVKWGAEIHVEEQVEEMAVDEHSGLHREMVDVAEEEAEMVAGAFQDDLDVFETEQRTQGLAIARTEQKVEDLEKKIDDNKEDLIREIRSAGGGG